MRFRRGSFGGRWFPRTLLAGAAVLLGGTVGFMWIESWSALDAFYMTVITVSTVGFDEVQPLSEAGRLFAVGLILGGVTTLGYALRALGERIVEAPTRRVERRMRRMKDHTIVCGYGRIGQLVAAGLQQHERPLCVIELAPARVARASEAGIHAVQGDATAEEVLDRAGIRQASAVAALLPHDGDNLSITMTATGLRPGIRVIARSEEERSRANLERAGASANDVVSPHTAAGRAVLRSLLSPGAARLFQEVAELTHGGFEAGEILVSTGSELAGKTLAEAAIGERRNVLVLAIQRAGRIVTVAPRGDAAIAAGDTLILLGDEEHLQRLGARSDGESAR